MIKIMKRLINRYYYTKVYNSLDDCQDILELAFLLKKENSHSRACTNRPRYRRYDASYSKTSCRRQHRC